MSEESSSGLEARCSGAGPCPPRLEPGGQDGRGPGLEESRSMQVKKPEAVSKEILERSPGSSRLRLSRASWVMAGLAVCLLDTAARAQYPQPLVEQLSERSGLVMRYVG